METGHISEVETGRIEGKYEYNGLLAMEEVNSEQYLGYILSNDGKNTNNINASSFLPMLRLGIIYLKLK